MVAFVLVTQIACNINEADYIETNHENSTHVAVSDGLEEGMEVIVENNLNLAHESLVTRRALRRY